MDNLNNMVGISLGIELDTYYNPEIG